MNLQVYCVEICTQKMAKNMTRDSIVKHKLQKKNVDTDQIEFRKEKERKVELYYTNSIVQQAVVGSAGGCVM